MVRILGIGVATMDVYIHQGRMYPGGNEYNIACHASLMGEEAGFLGEFGNDKAGELLEEALVRTGVDISHCRHEIGSSGYSLVELKEDGDRVFLDWNKQGVSDLYPPTFHKEELEYVKTFDVSCLGRCASISLDKIKYLHEQGVSLCYDFHATFDEDTVRSIAPYVDYAFFSCSHLDEDQTIAFLKHAYECGAGIAVGTRGCEMLYAYDGKQVFRQMPFKVKAKDALGAGDSFIAAFLANYIGGYIKGGAEKEETIAKSLEAAALYASKVVMMEGSIGLYYEIDISHIREVVNI